MEMLKSSSTTPRVLQFALLQKITDGFSEKQKVGNGGYGEVYKGKLDNGEEIAVKKLYQQPGLDHVQFKIELENLMRVRHQNIVQLVGYCYEIQHELVEHEGKTVFARTEYRILCLEYLQGGSLDKQLYEERRGFDWCTRYKIIKGICEGLNYLHGLEESILHLDLKPANILLDENMVPKIADFGLSRLFGGTHTHITKNLVGTAMYMPPEYLNKRIITKKYDVFSLGVIIIQIITGREGFSKYWEMSSSEYRVQQFIELVYQNWKVRVEATSAGEDCKQVKRCIEIALNCVETEREERPTIGDIIHKLRDTETMTHGVPMPFSQESGSASSSHFKTEMVQNWSQEKQCGGQVKDSSNQQDEVLQKQSGMMQGQIGNEDEVIKMEALGHHKQRALPKYLAFKGDNGMYLSARVIEGYNYLQFASSDIGDPTVHHTTFTNADGTVRIKSNHFGKFWRRSPNWIWADSADHTCNNRDTLFKVIRVDRNYIIALQSQGNDYFCKRLTTEGKTSCLNAAVRTITENAKLRFEEAVLSREIYDVNFDLSKAKIHGVKVLSMTTASTINDSSSANTAKLTLKYTQTETRTWDSSVTLKLGVETEMEAGVPFIVDAKVKLTDEFSGSYSWGSSIQKTTEQETTCEVTVPPKTKVTVSVLATQGTCDVPFSYKQDDLLYTGEKITYDLEDGLYTGVNCYALRYETKEEKIK